MVKSARVAGEQTGVSESIGRRQNEPSRSRTFPAQHSRRLLHCPRMKLPADAIIAPEKLTRYLLVRHARGDVVKIVDHHLSPNGENGYSIEVFNAVGDTIAITAVPESALESLRKDEVLSVRALTAAS